MYKTISMWMKYMSEPSSGGSSFIDPVVITGGPGDQLLLLEPQGNLLLCTLHSIAAVTDVPAKTNTDSPLRTLDKEKALQDEYRSSMS